MVLLTQLNCTTYILLEWTLLLLQKLFFTLRTFPALFMLARMLQTLRKHQNKGESLPAATTAGGGEPASPPLVWLMDAMDVSLEGGNCSSFGRRS